MNVKTTRTIAKVITLSLITSTMIHATNGDNLIAVGAKARGMGGTSIAVSHGAESGFNNAAMITTVEGTEIGFGGTLFMPDIETSFSGTQIPAQSHVSDADTNMIPEVSIAHKINENWYVGVGMWGTAGMGTDYRNAGTPAPFATGQFANFNMVTNLQLLQFGVPIAYKTGGLSLAVTPILQYGNLDINYYHPQLDTYIGNGLAQDFGAGYNLGLSYEMMAGLTFGVTYKSSIEMNYDTQLTDAASKFGITLGDDTLEQPAEYGVGIGYTTGPHTLGFDYKRIKWSDAKGYDDFGWEDSDVYAFGYQYTQDNWALRAGYNRASSAVVELTGPQNAAKNFFNLLGFPANSEKHYTVGGSYEFTNAFSVDLAYVHSPKASDTFDVSALAMGIDTLTTTHVENSVSFQLAYKF